MAIGGTSLTLRVFLASPGDVAAERAFVREFLESILPNDPLLPGRVAFELVSWDHPHAGTPMPAHLTPQDAVIHFKGRPSDCDIVIVVLAARLGTHLAVDAFKRPDGSAYLSGTEWEYEDARNATPLPEIMVYRRTDVPPIALRDPDRREKLRQYELVEQFFERFKHPDGSWKGGFRDYQGDDGFRTALANDLKYLVIDRLRTAARPPELPPPPPPAAPIIPPARCFGRDADVGALVAALTAPEQAVLLVLGPAGIGKTTVTRRVATDASIAARFAAQRWFAELDTANDAAALRVAIVQAIGRNPAATTFPEALAWLAQRPGLLVLDNLETPWEQDQRTVQDILQTLAATPGVSLLCSLRGAAAPPSPRWTRPPTHLHPLAEAEARRLFLELAPGIAADDPHLALFLAALGGVPLAVELLALRAAGDSTLRELWVEWRHRGMVLAAHPDLAPDHRLTSLIRSLDLSWQSHRLRDEGRRLFRLLGQLPAGIAEADRAALLGDAAAEAGRQLRTVGLGFERDGRLDLLPPVRDYARSVHPPPPQDQTAWRRHFLTLTRETGGRIYRVKGADAVARLAPESANIEAALHAAAAGKTLGETVAAIPGVWRFMSATGSGSLATLHALAAAYHAAGRTDSESRAWYGLGIVAFNRSEHDAARDAYQQAISLCRQTGDVLGEANCIKRIGDIALAHSELDAAREAYRRSLLVYQRIGRVFGEASAVHGLGNVALRRSEHDTAREAYHQALSLYRRAGSVYGEANCVRSLGDIALARSQPDAARVAYEQALSLFRQVGDVQGEADCIQSLGDIALARSQHDAARAAYEQALPLFRQVGAVRGEANCICRFGDIARAAGDEMAAGAQFETALDLYTGISEQAGVGWVHLRLARGLTGAKRDSHLAAARAAWLSGGLDSLAARLDDPDGIDDLEL